MWPTRWHVASSSCMWAIRRERRLFCESRNRAIRSTSLGPVRLLDFMPVGGDSVCSRVGHESLFIHRQDLALLGWFNDLPKTAFKRAFRCVLSVSWSKDLARARPHEGGARCNSPTEALAVVLRESSLTADTNACWSMEPKDWLLLRALAFLLKWGCLRAGSPLRTSCRVRSCLTCDRIFFFHVALTWDDVALREYR